MGEGWLLINVGGGSDPSANYIMYTCKGTHIDACMWISPRMAEEKVFPWIVMVYM